MERVRAKQLEELPGASWLDLIKRHSSVWIDVGTGDGLFTYELARKNPQVLCVGFDPAWENMIEVAGKAARKPQKGGAENALFLRARLEDYPDQLRNLASRVFVNYPWAGLLRGLVCAEPIILERLSALAAKTASIELYLNYHVLNSTSEINALNLPQLSAQYIEGTLLPAFRKFGLIYQRHELIAGKAPLRTTWGKELALGSGRETLHLHFKAT